MTHLLIALGKCISIKIALRSKVYKCNTGLLVTNLNACTGCLRQAVLKSYHGDGSISNKGNFLGQNTGSAPTQYREK